MKLNHKEKVKLARKMITPNDVKKGEGIFDSVAWKTRKKAIAKRVSTRKEKK